jgi:hypothetical protein
MQVFAPLLKSFWVGTALLLQPFHFKLVSRYYTIKYLWFNIIRFCLRANGRESTVITTVLLLLHTADTPSLGTPRKRVRGVCLYADTRQPHLPQQ